MNQLMRYGIIGIVSNLFIYLLYIIITYKDVQPKIAMTFLYFIGAIISFFANKKFTFNYKSKLFGSLARYLVAHFFGYLINIIILIIFVDKIGYPHQIVQGIAIFAVAGFLFVCFKFFVFRDFPLHCIENHKVNIFNLETHFENKRENLEKSN